MLILTHPKLTYNIHILENLKYSNPYIESRRLFEIQRKSRIQMLFEEITYPPKLLLFNKGLK